MMEARLNQAREALRAGHLDQADGLVQAVLVGDPTSVDGLNILGTVEIRRQRPAEAVRLFTAAAANDPTPKSEMNLGRTMESLGDPARAADVYRRILERFPQHAQARVALLRTLYATGAMNAMIEAAGPLPEALPLDAPGLQRLALAYVGEGKSLRAESLVDRALALDLQHAPSALLKAGLMLARGGYGEALPVLRHLLILDPGHGDALRMRAEAALRIRAADAVTWLLRAAAIDLPWRLRLELADALRAARRLEESAAQYGAVLDGDPENWNAVENLCTCLLDLKRYDDLAALAGRILGRLPKDVAVWNNFGIHLKTAGKTDLGVEYLKRALLLFPDSAALHYNIGFTLNDAMKAEPAEVLLRRAVRINPRYAKAWNALSVSLSIQYRGAEAEEACRMALRLNPRMKSTWLNLGISLRGRNKLGEAVAAMRQSIALDPKYAEAHQNLAYTLCMLGELEQGFKSYDWRWAVPGFPSSKRPFRLPVWDGRALGKDDGLLIYMEQGMGDEVMFSWYLPWVARTAENVTVECDERLIPLFARTFPTIRFLPRTFPADRRLFEPHLRFKVPAGHLPKFYWAELHELIASQWPLAGRRAVRTEPYLTPDPARVEHWRQYLRDRAGGRPLVGVSWRSALRTRTRDIQYLTPEELSQALGFDVAVVNLQYSHQDEELEAFTREGQRHGFHFIHPEGIDLRNDLDDLMALIAALDLVITPLISVAWMAGALGVPTWVFRSNEVTRIWQQFGTPIVPWTPSLRLFFRHPLQPWEGPLQTVRGELEAWLNERG
ncbi:MAG TPA: tetratricopeptide repeat protein [Azospirillum sp.]